MSIYIVNQCPICKSYYGNINNQCKQCNQDCFDDACFHQPENLCVVCLKEIERQKELETRR